MDTIFRNVFPDHSDIQLVSQPKDFDCLRFFIDAFEQNCEPLDDYGLKFVKNFVHMCETADEEEMTNRFT